MRGFLTAVALTAALSLTLCAVGQASPRASHHATKHVAKQQRFVVASAAGNAACDPSKCSGACPHRGAAAASTKAAGSACPVSDPSACPASCSHQNASAVAASVSGH